VLGLRKAEPLASKVRVVRAAVVSSIPLSLSRTAQVSLSWYSALTRPSDFHSKTKSHATN